MAQPSPTNHFLPSVTSSPWPLATSPWSTTMSALRYTAWAVTVSRETQPSRLYGLVCSSQATTRRSMTTIQTLLLEAEGLPHSCLWIHAHMPISHPSEVKGKKHIENSHSYFLCSLDFIASQSPRFLWIIGWIIYLLIHGCWMAKMLWI